LPFDVALAAEVSAFVSREIPRAAKAPKQLLLDGTTEVVPFLEQKNHIYTN